jgi:hypothetical protein
MMADLETCEDLSAARRTILADARAGGPPVAVAMLAEALRQLELLTPAVSAEVWSGYAAVRAVATAAVGDAAAAGSQEAAERDAAAE